MARYIPWFLASTQVQATPSLDYLAGIEFVSKHWLGDKLGYVQWAETSLVVVYVRFQQACWGCFYSWDTSDVGYKCLRVCFGGWKGRWVQLRFAGPFQFVWLG